MKTENFWAPRKPLYKSKYKDRLLRVLEKRAVAIATKNRGPNEDMHSKLLHAKSAMEIYSWVEKELFEGVKSELESLMTQTKKVLGSLKSRFVDISRHDVVFSAWQQDTADLLWEVATGSASDGEHLILKAVLTSAIMRAYEIEAIQGEDLGCCRWAYARGITLKQWYLYYVVGVVLPVKEGRPLQHFSMHAMNDALLVLDDCHWTIADAIRALERPRELTRISVRERLYATVKKVMLECKEDFDASAELKNKLYELMYDEPIFEFHDNRPLPSTLERLWGLSGMFGQSIEVEDKRENELNEEEIEALNNSSIQEAVI